jgi:hypothetical protein
MKNKIKIIPVRPAGETWLYIDNAADFLGYSRYWICKLAKDGKITSRKTKADKRYMVEVQNAWDYFFADSIEDKL